MIKNNGYQLRGQRVSSLNRLEINEIAKAACRVFDLTAHTIKQPAFFVEHLHDYGITVDVWSDKEWQIPAEAVCVVESGMIAIPESLYIQIESGEKKALHVLFHELGHLLLAHKPVFHYPLMAAPTKEEDAEWQADEFANSILLHLGIEDAQMSFDF